MIFDGQVNVDLLMVAMGSVEVYSRALCQVCCREQKHAEAEVRQDRVGMCAQRKTYEARTLFTALIIDEARNLENELRGKSERE